MFISFQPKAVYNGNTPHLKRTIYILFAANFKFIKITYDKFI